MARKRTLPWHQRRVPSCSMVANDGRMHAEEVCSTTLSLVPYRTPLQLEFCVHSQCIQGYMAA